MAIDDGQVIKPIGTEKVDRTFQASLATEDYERIHTAIDPENKLVMWGVPGRPGTLWMYNWEIDRWSTAEFNFTGLMSGYTSSLTLEDVSALYSDLDATPYSLDSPRFSGGSPRLYVFDGDNKIATFTGDNLVVTITPAFFEPIKGRRARITAVRPITDATEGVTVTIDHRQRLGDNRVATSADSIRDSGIMPLRCSGKYVQPETVINDNDWSFINGFELEYSGGGIR
jgi:hypothetical protein